MGKEPFSTHLQEREPGVPEKLIRVTKSNYMPNNINIRIQMNREESGGFFLNKVDKSGNSLAFLLFIIIIHRLLKNIRNTTNIFQTVIGYKSMDFVNWTAYYMLMIANIWRKMQLLISEWNREISKLNGDQYQQNQSNDNKLPRNWEW